MLGWGSEEEDSAYWIVLSERRLLLSAERLGTRPPRKS